MFIRSMMLVVVCLLFGPGCLHQPAGQGAGTTNPEIASAVKDQVTSFIDGAKKSPRSAKGKLDLMLESLEGAAGRSEGFAKVRDEAKQLQALYQSNADTAALKSQMETLQAAADQLTQASP